MIATASRHANDSEANARMAWWLDTTGEFPTVEQLLAIREYRASERVSS